MMPAIPERGLYRRCPRAVAWALRWIAACATLALASSAGDLRPVRAQEARPAIRVERNLVYGRGGQQDLKLDLAMPREGAGPFPAVVCLHGGGWKAGNREDLARTIEAFARRGYVAVTVDYRLAPVHKAPAQIEDCKAAVRWLRANHEAYHVNPDRVGALGFSAGAHLACLLGVTDKGDGLEGNGGHAEQSSRVQAVVSFFGPTDFTRKSWTDDLERDVLAPLLGGGFAEKPEEYRRWSPVSYVTKDDPPFLFFHGTKDELVSVRHSRTLAEKLRGVGVEARVVELEGEGHGWSGPRLTRTIAQTIEFFDEHLKK